MNGADRARHLAQPCLGCRQLANHLEHRYLGMVTVKRQHQEKGMLLESTSRDWRHWQHSILVGASCP